MFERIKRLYDANVLTIEGLRNAVEKGLITELQFVQISGHDFDEGGGEDAIDNNT